MLDERDQGLTLGLIGFVLPEVLYAGTLSVTQIIQILSDSLFFSFNMTLAYLIEEIFTHYPDLTKQPKH